MGRKTANIKESNSNNETKNILTIINPIEYGGISRMTAARITAGKINFKKLDYQYKSISKVETYMHKCNYSKC